jgi:hypothetical protein
MNAAKNNKIVIASLLALCAGCATTGTPEPKSPAAGVPLANVEEVALGLLTSCARKTDGTVLCWGYDGDESPGAKPWQKAPSAVPGLSAVVQIASGMFHSCARTKEGKVLCWGNNDKGQLGDGTTTKRKLPAPVPGIDVSWLRPSSTHHATMGWVAGGTNR